MIRFLLFISALGIHTSVLASDVLRVEHRLLDAIKATEGLHPGSRSVHRRYTLIKAVMETHAKNQSDTKTMMDEVVKIAGTHGLHSFNPGDVESAYVLHRADVVKSIKDIILHELELRSIQSSTADQNLSQTLSDIIDAAVSIKNSIFLGNDDWAQVNEEMPINLVLDGIEKIVFLHILAEVLNVADLIDEHEVQRNQVFSCANIPENSSVERLPLDFCHLIEGSGYERVPFSKLSSDLGNSYFSFIPVVAKFSTGLVLLYRPLMTHFHLHLIFNDEVSI